MKQWLVDRRPVIWKSMLICLSGGMLLVGAGSLEDGRIDWKHAALLKSGQVMLKMNDDGKLAFADPQGGAVEFFCPSDDAVCRLADGQALPAEVEYLFVPQRGAVMLAVSYRQPTTQEQVMVRYPQNLIDEQADKVEMAGWHWRNVLVYLRHILLTSFFGLLFIWLYAGRLMKHGFKPIVAEAANKADEENGSL